MAHFKISHRIGLFLALLLFLSCNKEAKVKMGGEIHAIMPHTNTPIAGIKWKVVETKSGGLYSNAKNTGWVLEGETDANGYALVAFFPKKSIDYSYTINFDYSHMNLSAGDYKIVGGPPEYAIMERGYKTIQNTYNIRVLPFTSRTFNFKNVNCFDVNDQFKYKFLNIASTPIVYPNPNSGSFTVSWEGVSTGTSLQLSVFDLSRKQLFSVDSEVEAQVRHELEKGLYIVKIQKGELWYSKRIVVE